MADYVIIGGGVYGVATAWHLARQGASVIVIERKTVASGASGGPGRRGVRANFRDGRELPLMQAAYPMWEALSDTLGTTGLFQRTGNLMLVGDARDMPQARAQAQIQSRLGIESHILDADDVRGIEPDVETGIAGGVFCPRDGLSDHTATTRAYAVAARSAGVTIRENTEAAEVIISDGRATGFRLSDGTTIAAAHGVLVLSNWSVADLLGSLADLPVWSDAFQVLVSHPLPYVPVRHVVGHLRRTVSLKPEPGNRLMISGGHRGAYDRQTHIGTALPGAIAANVADAVGTYPVLDGITIETADAGHLESVAVDDIPIIDHAPGIANLWFATGWSGHGWAIAPVVAALMADYAATGTRPGLLAPFALGRFDPA